MNLLAQLSFGAPWVLATIYGALLGIFILMRFARGKWQSIRLESEGTGDKLVLSAAI